MTRRILLVNPLGTDMVDELTVDLVRPHLAADTHVECWSLGDTVPPSPYRSSPEQHYNQLIGLVRNASEEFDAIGISCCGDPALRECRQVSKVPVTGALEAMCRTAANFTPVTIMQRFLPNESWRAVPTQKGLGWMRDNVTSYGLTADAVAYKTVVVDGHPEKDTLDRLSVEDPAQARDLMLAAMEKAALGHGLEQSRLAQEEGAGSVYFACTFWGGQLEPLQAALDIPVLDPLRIVAKYTEYLATIG